MTTQVIIIGKTDSKPTLAPIEFHYSLSDLDPASPCVLRMRILSADDRITMPSQYQYIELICKNYIAGLDLMFAYTDPLNRGDGYLYAGKFNDGIVG